MAISTITAIFHSSVEEVWNIVTSLENYTWRSDLNRIEILNDKQFIEYTKEDYTTTFTITTTEPCKRWEFDIENGNMKGHWIGVFTSIGEDTKVTFTEEITVKKFIMKPFIKGFLKKQQRVYVDDLEKEINRIVNTTKTE